MATQPPGNDRPPTGNAFPQIHQTPRTPVQGQTQHAPSLDVMAAQSSAAAALRVETTDPGAVSAMAQESRSSSSTNSPLPYDNAESDFFIVGNDSESSLGVSNLQDVHITGTDDNASDAESEGCVVPPVNRVPNEILMVIFSRLSSHIDLLNCILTSKRWARNSIDLLWHRPACTNWPRHQSVCQTLAMPNQYFPYKEFIKRLNLASIADQVNDGSVMPLAVCNRIERLTLTNCKNLTDTGLMALVQNSSHLLALDISFASQITEATVFSIAQFCKRLQGLNITGCTKISNEGMIALAQNCKYIKRIKLNECTQVTDETVSALANNCPNILEIDLQNCRLVTNAPITELMTKGQALRELRLTYCELIDDNAFLDLPEGRTFEHLRIMDLTSCVNLTDLAVDRIIKAAPRLRNLVLAKCRNITDASVNSISRLGKNLHYLHLGHCANITDDAVKRLVYCCNRIRYIDLGCCTNLTDDSVTRLATLPKLKRIGLVKCSNITDESVYALARANQRRGQRREQYAHSGVDADGNSVMEGTGGGGGAGFTGAGGVSSSSGGSSSLERVHLSYCSLLTIRSIIRLLNACNRLTHLSLTGVTAFLREDLARFCRSPPPEFTVHQREMFCVFSGDGVSKLRNRLNEHPQYDMYRDRPAVVVETQPLPSLAEIFNGGLPPNMVPNGHHILPNIHQEPHEHAAGGGGGDENGNGPTAAQDFAAATYNQLHEVPTPLQQAHLQTFQEMQRQRAAEHRQDIEALWQQVPGMAGMAGGPNIPQTLLNALQPYGQGAANPPVIGTHVDADGETVNHYAYSYSGDQESDMLVDATINALLIANVNHRNANLVPPPPPPPPQAPAGAQPPTVLTSTPTTTAGRPLPFEAGWRAALVNQSLTNGPRSAPLNVPIMQPPAAPASSSSTASVAPIGGQAPGSQTQPATGASAASLSGAAGPSTAPTPTASQQNIGQGL